MMKRIMALFLAGVMSIGIAVQSGAAEVLADLPESEPCEAELSETEGCLTYSVSNGEATITGCYASTGDSLTIPSTLGGYPVTSIGDGAFYYCANFTSITIPGSVKSIGEDAFGHSSLRSVTIENGVTNIGGRAFEFCHGLTDVTIPGSVKSIGWYAFENCSGLTSVTIENGVQSIENYAFTQCTRLKSITIPGSVKSIEWGAFSSCIALTSATILDGVTGIADSMFANCTSLTNVSIPNSVTSIGHEAFCDCTGLVSITIPSSVTSIGDFALVGCYNLLSITVDAGNRNYCSIDGALYTADRKTLLRFPAGKKGTYVIPNGVTSIEKGAFDCSSGLTEITIPNSVTSIGEQAFFACGGLKRITLPNGLTSVGYSMFQKCSGLTSITIPDGVTSIGYLAFEGCTGLKSVTIPSSVTSIAEAAFGSCTNLTTITIPDGVSIIGDRAFSRCSGLNSIVFPNSVTRIGDWALDYCYNLKGVYYAGSEDDWKRITKNSSLGIYNPDVFHFNASAYTSYIGTIKNNVPKGSYVFNIVDDTGAPIKGATVTWNDDTCDTDDLGMASFSAFSAGTPVVTVKKNGYIDWTNEGGYWEKSEDRFEMITLYPLGKSDLMLVSAIYHADDKPSCDVLRQVKTVSLPVDGSLITSLDDGTFSLRCTAKNPDNVAGYILRQGIKELRLSYDGVFSDLDVKYFNSGDCYVRVYNSNGEYADTHLNLVFKKDSVNKQTGFSIGPKGLSVKVSDKVPFFGGSTFKMNFPISCPLTFDVSESPKIKVGFNCEIDGDEKNYDKLKETCKQAKKIVGKKPDKKWLKDVKKLAKKSNKCDFFGGCDVYVIGYAEGDAGKKTLSGELFVMIDVSLLDIEYNAVVVVVPVTVQVGLSFGMSVGGSVEYDFTTSTFNGNISLDPSLELTAFGGIGVSKFVGVGAYGSAEVSADINLIGTEQGIRKIDLTGELGLKAYLAFLTYEKPFGYHTWHLYTASSASLSEADGEAWLSGIDDASNYHVHDLSYMKNESAWNGSGASLLEAEAKTVFQPLLEGTYRNARPVMIGHEGALYAAFVRADEEEHTYIAVTKYDGHAWCEPVRVSDTFYAEAPVLYASDGGDIYLAYVSADAFDRLSLTDYAAKTEIVVGTLDAETLAFSEQTAFASDDYLRQPQLLDVNGEPTIVFERSAVTGDNSVLSPEGTEIVYAAEVSGTWDNPSVYASFDENVLQVSAAEKAGALVCAVGAGSGLYVGGDLITEEPVGRLSFGRLPGSDADAFIYNTESALNDTEGNTLQIAGITNEYAVIGQDVYYSRADEDGANLYVLKHGTSETPVRLTDAPRYLENLNAARIGGSDYVLGMATLAAITEESIEDDKNLVFARVMPVSDIVLDYAVCEEETAGEKVPLTVGITNAGDHTVTALDVTVGGKPVDVSPFTLAPGESAEMEIEVLCPDERQTMTVCVSEHGKDDYTPGDNERSVTLGCADLSIKLGKHIVGSRHIVTAYVTNEGIGAAAGKVLLTDAEGKTVTERTVGTLAAGDTEAVLFEIDDALIPKDGLAIRAEVISDEEDRSEANNDDTVCLTARSYFCSVSRMEIGDGEAIIGTWLEDGVTAALYIAEYDAKGRLLRLTAEAPASGESEHTAVIEEGCAMIKVFMTDENLQPLCEAASLKVAA